MKKSSCAGKPNVEEQIAKAEVKGEIKQSQKLNFQEQEIEQNNKSIQQSNKRVSNPYDLLKQKGIPSTFDDLDREILDSGNWRMQSQGAADPKTYQTYTKTNPTTGEVYSGRTSGTGTPAENVAKRDANHHMNDKGFGPAELDKASSNKNAIRGREQQLIESNGGAKSEGGTSGNAINGIGPNNMKKDIYIQAAEEEFK